MNNAKKMAIGIVAAAGLVGALSFLLPAPEASTTALGAKLLVVFPMTFAVLHLGAIPFFILGLKSFKNEMRRAYLLICIGIVLFSIAQLQFPLLSALNMWEGFWIESGLLAVPYLLPGVFFYFGARQLSTVLHISNRARSFWLVLGAAIAATLVAVMLPHKDIGLPDELSFDINTGIIVWSGVWYTAAAIMLASVRKTIGQLYHMAMAWLVLAFLILIASCIQLFIFQQIGYENWYATYFIFLPDVLSGLTFMRAAYAFYEVSKY